VPLELGLVLLGLGLVQQKLQAQQR